MALRSRATFPSIFCRQKSARVAGHLKSWHSCPCQKQPLIKTTALYLGSFRSGFPGSWCFFFLGGRRKRKPLIWRADLITSSGFVSLPRMPDIIRLRVLELTISGNVKEIFLYGIFRLFHGNMRSHVTCYCLNCRNDHCIPKLSVSLGVGNRDYHSATSRAVKPH